MIKHFKIKDLKIIIANNFLITNYYKKHHNKFELGEIRGIYNPIKKRIISNGNKNNLLHELLHNFDYCFFDFYINKKCSIGFKLNKFDDLENEFFEKIKNKLLNTNNLDLRYRLKTTEILSWEFTDLITKFNLLNSYNDFILNLKLLKNFYGLNTFEGIYLRILARYKFFKTLYNVFDKIK